MFEPPDTARGSGAEGGFRGVPPPQTSPKPIDATRSIDDTLSGRRRQRPRNLPGFEHVGISTVDRDGRIQTRAATDDLVNRLDDLQYGLDEGPCVDPLHEPDVVAAPSIRFITRASSTSNTKLRVVAHEVVESVGRSRSASPVAGPGGHHHHDDPGGA
jgi:hypothetical protein